MYTVWGFGVLGYFFSSFGVCFVVFCEYWIRSSDAFDVGGGAGAGCGRCVERHFSAQERDVATRGSVKSSRGL